MAAATDMVLASGLYEPFGSGIPFSTFSPIGEAVNRAESQGVVYTSDVVWGRQRTPIRSSRRRASSGTTKCITRYIVRRDCASLRLSGTSTPTRDG